MILGTMSENFRSLDKNYARDMHLKFEHHPHNG